MLRTQRHILWSLVLLASCSSLAWGQGRVYGPERKFHLLLLGGWTTGVQGSSLRCELPVTSGQAVLLGRVQDANVVNIAVNSIIKMRSDQGWSVKRHNHFEGSQAVFQIVETTPPKGSRSRKQILAIVHRYPASASGPKGFLHVTLPPNGMSELELSNAMMTIYSFRLEGAPKIARPPQTPPPSVPEPVEDDF